MRRTQQQPRRYCTYLYADGHAVIVYEKHDRDAGPIKYVEVVEHFGPRCDFEGRLVLHNEDGLVNLIRRAHSVEAVEPSLKHGSENSRKAGLAVGYLRIQLSDKWQDSVCFNAIPDLISGPYTYQPTQVETFDPVAFTWSDYHVARIHRVKQQPAAAEKAA